MTSVADDMLNAVGASGEKPYCEFVAQMTQSGARPDANASDFKQRQSELFAKLSSLGNALYDSETGGAQILNGRLICACARAKAANDTMASVTEAMRSRKGPNCKMPSIHARSARPKSLLPKTICQAIENTNNGITNLRNNAAEDDADPTNDVYMNLNDAWEWQPWKGRRAEDDPGS
jgi:hypothetical protein